MKISYNWIKELVPDMQQTPEELAELLTLHSFETEVDDVLAAPKGITVVKITALAKHPNADRLQLATVTDGEKEVVVVCGAPNIAVGQVVPYSPPGTTLVDEEGNDFIVKEATIRGEVSPGMLNSLKELGLHAKDHSGIWILPEDTPLGSELAEHIPTDTILDVDMTPNRAHDCLSHIGIAREVAALLQLSVQEPQYADVSGVGRAITVEIEDDHDAPRYVAAEIAGAKIAPSPLWMQARLLAVGSKPKNNIVDTTNYVLFEYGNPTHIFDASALPAKKIDVRKAKSGEKLVALDEETYELAPDDLVIASEEKLLAIAGVMGGQDSGVQATSSELVLEVANFRPYQIAQTSRRLKLRSESSIRFEKGIHPQQVEQAAARIVYLLQTLTGASLASYTDTQTEELTQHHIQFRPERPSEVTGIAVDTDEVANILRRLRFAVDDTNEIWDVTVPHDRLDVMGEHDVVEEVVRVIGFQEVPIKEQGEVLPKAIDGTIAARMALTSNLAVLGFTETYGLAFEPAAYASLLGDDVKLDAKPHVTVVNPPAPELANLRISLLPGLLQQVEGNRDAFQKQSGRRERGLFEVGHIYKPDKDATRVPGVDERTFVSGVGVSGICSPEDIVQVVADSYGVDSDLIMKYGYVRYTNEAITKKLKYRKPLIVFKFDITAIELHAELVDLEPKTIEEIKKTDSAMQFEPYSKYPVATRDISLLVDPSVSVEDAQGIIERTGGELVVDVDVFDEIEWKDENKKGIAFHVEYQATDRTLTDKEIGTLHERITKTLQEEISAQIR